jgi:folate-dependent phosphoribosylglycinamide formyltransferase PurN
MPDAVITPSPFSCGRNHLHAAHDSANIADMRLVVLAFGGVIAERVLTHLALEGLIAEALILSKSPHGPRGIRQPAPVPATRVPLVRRAAAVLLTRALRRVHAHDSAQVDPLARWRGLAVAVHQVPTLHDPVATELLRALSPDYILLAGAGIVGDNVLGSARVGIVNVHPALLPWVRGLGGLEASLLRGLPPGVTAHLVDSGIDTGPILHRQLVPVSAHDTLDSLRRKADTLCAHVTTHLLLAAAGGTRLVGIPQQARFPYARHLTASERAEAAQLVARGATRRTYDQWRTAAGGDVLPDGDERLPVPTASS